MDYFLLIAAGLMLFAVGCQRAAEDSGPGGGGGRSAASTGPSTAPSGGGVGRVERSDVEWRALLSPDEYAVLRRKGTERAFTGKYDHHFEPGSYACAACGLELFSSDTKFDSRCGWPAFYAAKAGDRVKLTADDSHGMHRVEVTCARCGGHLGHVFDDAPDKPTGQRYCINSVSLKFIPAGTAGATTTTTKPAATTGDGASGSKP